MREEFLAPFNFINLNLTLSFDHMAVQKFVDTQSDEWKKKDDKLKKEKQKKDKDLTEQGFIVEKTYYKQITESIKEYRIKLKKQKDGGKDESKEIKK